jgi:superfamily II DNA or RNA helicase/DNA-binding CsgD family transcriptional regulator
MTIKPENQASEHCKNSSFQQGIEILNLSQRSYNCLKRAGKHTIKDLLLMTSEELIKLKNFGKNSHDEVIRTLESLGLYLIDDSRAESNQNIIQHLELEYFEKKEEMQTNSPVRKFKQIDLQEQYFQLFKNGISEEEIASKFDINISKVKRVLSNHPDYLKEKTNQKIKAIQEKRRKKYDPYMALYKQGLSMKEIADKFKVSQMTVSRCLNQHPDYEKWKEELREQQLEEERLKREKQTDRQIENLIYYSFEEQINQYWDWETNQKHGIDPYQVQRGASQIIYLQCPIDGYRWSKKACDITKDSWQHGRSGCRVCAGKIKDLKAQPTLSETHPEFVDKYWDFEENSKENLDPKIITCGSNRKAWFKCPIDGFEWEANIAGTIKQQWSKGNAGCKVCNGTDNRKYTGWSKAKLFIEDYPEMIEKYWHYEKNNELNLFPDKVTSGSAKKAWWKCPIDNFEWQAGISSIQLSWKLNNSGCPKCNIGWNHKTILAFVKSLTPVLSSLEPAELYSILRQNGLISASKRLSKNKDLINDIVKLTYIAEEKKEKAIENICNKLELNVVDDIKENFEPDDELKENKLPSKEEIIEQEELPMLSPQNILKTIDSLKSLIANPDEETVEFLISKAVGKLWKKVLNNEELQDLEEIEKYQDGEYSAEVKKRFLSQYKGAKALEIPNGYSFKINEEIVEPNLMQRLIAYRVLAEKRVGNWSGTGAGKTMGAILASRIINSKITLIIALNNTLEGWKNEILHTFPDSHIHIKNRYEFINQGEYNYLLLNYETFQMSDSSGYVKYLINNFKVDMIILDEIHSTKHRDGVEESRRRQVINGLLSKAQEKNIELSVIGMSATPVINGLEESVSLLEMVKGIKFDDLDTKPTISNAMAVHEKLVVHGIRYVPKYKIKLHEECIEINGNSILENLQQIRKGQVLDIEKVLLKLKIEKILDLLESGTLIYTQYVEEIVPILYSRIKEKGFTVGLFTGQEKSGLNEFKEGRIDILIGSSAIGTGVDGLQYVCNRLIIANLPWTSAGYEQLLGRVYRQGSKFQDVTIFIPQIVLENNGDEWSWDKQRLDRIKYKKTLADATVDGLIPEGNLISQSEMLSESMKALSSWIERLESGNIQT